MSRKPRSILEYPIVARKVLNDLVISMPDIGIWVQVPLPAPEIINGVPQTSFSDAFLLGVAKAFKSTWIKGHKHINEKKWVPDASSFKQSVIKAEKDLTVTGFKNKIAKHMSVSENTIRREIKRGRIKCRITAGGHRRIPDSEVSAYLDRTMNPNPGAIVNTPK